MSDVMMEEELLHQPGAEPIPGYRLISPLGRGGFGEVWKCEAPGGLLKAIKFVRGSDNPLDRSAPADEELRAVQRVKSIRHPFILSMERVEVVEGELVIVSELADRNLADLLADRRAAGEVGIARDALLAYLREAAEALDVMHVRHGLQHLDVKPQNLFLVADHVKVGDFGLVQSVSATGDVALGAITPLYASPEVFEGRLSPHADQYSLAIVFQELLTGTLPFDGKNSRQLMIQHVQGAPNLEPLCEADRPVVARALAKDPSARFRSCSELIQALATGQTAGAGATVVDLPLRPAAAPDKQDTRRTPVARTVKTRTIGTQRPPAAPFVGGGTKILDLISRTPHSETWSARGGDGAARTVKVLFANPTPEAVARLAALRHPALAPVEVLLHTPGQLILSMPAGERTVRDVYAEHHGRGEPGIPRGRLLGWLRRVAEALLDLAEDESLYHLALQPRSLLLEGERVRMTDFGLAQLVWQPSGRSPGSVEARYAAPELSAGPAGPACDQYSLALLYHELTTGSMPLPLPGKSVPSLARLPEAERDAISRALHPDPAKRWPSAADLFDALAAANRGSESAKSAPDAAPAQPSSSAPAASDVLQARLGTSLTADTIRQRMEGFRKQWSARLLKARSQSFTFDVQTPGGLWQRLTGRHPGLEVRVDVGEPEMTAPAGVQVRTEVLLTIRPRGGSPDRAEELLTAVGPLLVDSIRQHLRAATRGRQQERVPWPYPLQACAVLPDGQIGPAIDCQGKDVSLNGIGFYLPGQLPGSQLQLHLPETAQTPQTTVQARVVRVQGCGDGWHEVGAVLLVADEAARDEGSQAGA